MIIKNIKMELINKISKITNIPKEDILNIYSFGSVVYNTNNENSDLDFLIVVSNKYKLENGKEYKNGKLDIHINSIESFKYNLEEHKIKYIECMFIKATDNIIKIEKYKFNFKLDKFKLRRSISSIVNNSWSKANKKMTLDVEDTYIGVKSLFHSIRIIDLGIQLGKSNKIYNFDFKKLWEEILNKKNSGYNWEQFKLDYKPIYNQKLTEFRRYCPKQ